MSIVFRFFPTVKEEYYSINHAMKLRGISFAGDPIKMLEYRIVPHRKRWKALGTCWNCSKQERLGCGWHSGDAPLWRGRRDSPGYRATSRLARRNARPVSAPLLSSVSSVPEAVCQSLPGSVPTFHRRPSVSLP